MLRASGRFAITWDSRRRFLLASLSLMERRNGQPDEEFESLLRGAFRPLRRSPTLLHNSMPFQRSTGTIPYLDQRTGDRMPARAFLKRSDPPRFTTSVSPNASLIPSGVAPAFHGETVDGPEGCGLDRPASLVPATPAVLVPIVAQGMNPPGSSRADTLRRRDAQSHRTTQIFAKEHQPRYSQSSAVSRSPTSLHHSPRFINVALAKGRSSSGWPAKYCSILGWTRCFPADERPGVW